MSSKLFLIQKLVDRTISFKEKALLEHWIKKNEYNTLVFKNTIKTLEKEKQTNFNSDVAFSNFMKTINKKQPKITFKVHSIYKYAAALLILLSIGYQTTNATDSKSDYKIGATPLIKNKEAITITLADGSTKFINANNATVLKNANGLIIANTSNNGLVFKNNGGGKTLLYNEIFVPNGKTLKFQLSDGTTVWLNSGSHFKFPQDFKYDSDYRKVYLTGEAFFDVSTNKRKPFIVDNDGFSIEVLGTQFNVSSYKNEAQIATTLVEGAVSVYDNALKNNTLKLTPGFQAAFNKTDKKLKRKKVDTDIYTAWTNNILVINNLNFQQILNKLERKYDVTIINNTKNLNHSVYKGEFKEETIETVLETIALSSSFHFEINGKTILIQN